jgi:hypothetical protein
MVAAGLHLPAQGESWPDLGCINSLTVVACGGGRAMRGRGVAMCGNKEAGFSATGCGPGPRGGCATTHGNARGQPAHEAGAEWRGGLRTGGAEWRGGLHTGEASLHVGDCMAWWPAHWRGLGAPLCRPCVLGWFCGTGMEHLHGLRLPCSLQQLPAASTSPA